MGESVAIGIDIGGTNLRAARVSSSGVVEDRVAERIERAPAAVLERIAAAIERLHGPDVTAVGLGVPGRVDAARRRVLSGGYVDLSAADPVGMVETRFRLPVVLDNDVSMALVAEHALGAARGRSEAVMLAIGTGIGGAVLARGTPLRGRGNAGQLGHVVVDAAGPPCACGRGGCLEALAAGPALARLSEEAGLCGMRAEPLVQAALEGEPAAAKVASRWAGALRSGIESIAAVLDPEIVVLGGGLGRAAAAALAAFGPPPSRWFACEVLPAALGDEAGMVGCALAALHGARP